MLDVQLPEGAAPDSHNLSGLLTGTSDKGREWVIQQNLYNKLAIRNKEGWKWIEPSEHPAYNPNTDIELGNSKQEQLYNLKTDIGDRYNLAECHPEIVKALRSKLNEEKAKGYLMKCLGNE